jgi:hypothetical protein
VSEAVDWREVRDLLDALYSSTDRLEALFPGRKFTLDGHLVGSIGEVVAAYMFGLALLPGSSKGHDAAAPDGRRVEVKFTQGGSVAIRHEPDHLIVLQRRKGASVQIVFNGPGALAWSACGALQKNGQRPVSISRLKQLDTGVPPERRLPVLRPAPV